MLGSDTASTCLSHAEKQTWGLGGWVELLGFPPAASDTPIEKTSQESQCDNLKCAVLS